MTATSSQPSGEIAPLQLVFEFESSVDQNAAWIAELLKKDPQFRTQAIHERRPKRIRDFLLCVILALLVLSIERLLGFWLFQRPLNVALWVFGVSFAIVMVLRWPPRGTVIEWMAEQASYKLALKLQWKLGQPTRIEVGDDGIHVVQPDRDSFYRWEAIVDCRATPAGVLVILGSTEGFGIPRHAFTDESQMAALASLIVTRRQISGADPDSIAARVLAESDLRCPKCRYQMRGCQSATCPECGERVGVELLRAVEVAAKVELD